MRDSLFGDVDNQEAFDHVPVLNIFLPLLKFHCNFVDKVLLLRSFFEHCFELELTILQLFKSSPIIIEHFHAFLFAGIARLFLRNCIHESIQIHHLTLDPIPNVFEWVKHFLTQAI